MVYQFVTIFGLLKEGNGKEDSEEWQERCGGRQEWRGIEEGGKKKIGERAEHTIMDI